MVQTNTGKDTRFVAVNVSGMIIEYFLDNVLEAV